MGFPKTWWFGVGPVGGDWGSPHIIHVGDGGRVEDRRLRIGPALGDGSEGWRLAQNLCVHGP